MSKDSSSPTSVSKTTLYKVAIIVQTVLIGLLLYIVPAVIAGLLLIVGSSVSGASASQTKDWLDHSAAAQFIYVLITESLVVVSIVGFMKFFGDSWHSIGVRRPMWRHFTYTIGGFFLYYAIYIVIAAIVSQFVALNFDQRQEIGFSTGTAGSSVVFAFAALVVLPPIVEEILFRGFLYTHFKKALSVRPAAVAVSLLFAAAHLQFGTGNALLWVAAMDTFVLSLVLVYLREKTGTIWPGVGVHALKNLLAFLILFKVITP